MIHYPFSLTFLVHIHITHMGVDLKVLVLSVVCDDLLYAKMTILWISKESQLRACPI